MFGFLVVIHILVSIIMIVFILLQDPKGGGALGMLGGGGGSKSLFGSTGANQFLVNITKWSAILFAVTSIALATLSSKSDKSIMDEYIPQTTQQEKTDTAPEGEGTKQTEPSPGTTDEKATVPTATDTKKAEPPTENEKKR